MTPHLQSTNSVKPRSAVRSERKHKIQSEKVATLLRQRLKTCRAIEEEAEQKWLGGKYAFITLTMKQSLDGTVLTDDKADVLARRLCKRYLRRYLGRKARHIPNPRVLFVAERAPETGRLHMHGLVEIMEGQTLDQVFSLIKACWFRNGWSLNECDCELAHDIQAIYRYINKKFTAYDNFRVQ